MNLKLGSTLHPTLALTDARQWPMSCSELLRLGCNEADAVRLAQVRS